MRRAGDLNFIEENGEVIGFALGADYVAEHEWGIDGILNKFGIEPIKIKSSFEKNRNSKAGLIDVILSKVGELSKPSLKLGFLTNTKESFFTTPYKNGYFFYSKGYDEKSLDYLERATNGTAAWDGDNFAIFIEETALINKFMDAEKNNDISIFLIPSDNPFGGTGLGIFINSLIPQEVKDKKIKAQKDLISLYERMDETGIEIILNEAEKRYMALSPRMNNDGEIVFWLNPYDQRNNNYGQYTVQELKDWTENKGPIPKKGN